MKIKKNDKIIMIAGKDRGKTGKVTHVLPTSKKVVVENLNLTKKHFRPKKQGQKGQIVEIARAVNVSNVKLFCPKCSIPARAGYKVQSGNKYRICKKCQQEI